jgi:spermidine/putrescine transport system permease protein
MEMTAKQFTGQCARLIRRHRSLHVVLLLGPALVWAVIFVFVPCAIMMLMSFWQVRDEHIVRVLTWHNYQRIFHRYVYYGTLLHSIRIAGAATGLALLLALPMAYITSFKIGRWKTIVFPLIVVSLWVGYLLRAFSWRLTLGDRGILNGVLLSSGVINAPSEMLLYSPVSVLVALTNLAVPFALIPIFTAFEQVPRPLLDAAADLGAGPVTRFLCVTFPLALHGVVLGAEFAFILTFGDFLAPALVGGPTGMMAANLVASEFGASFQWPLGCALSVLMFVAVVFFMALAQFVQWLVLRPVAAPRKIAIDSRDAFSAGQHG